MSPCSDHAPDQQQFLPQDAVLLRVVMAHCAVYKVHEVFLQYRVTCNLLVTIF